MTSTEHGRATETPTCETASLSINLIEAERVTLVGHGRFDERAAGYIHHRLSRLLGAGFRTIELDLSAVEIIDAAGFAPIASVAAQAHLRAGRVSVSGMTVDLIAVIPETSPGLVITATTES